MEQSEFEKEMAMVQAMTKSIRDALNKKAKAEREQKEIEEKAEAVKLYFCSCKTECHREDHRITVNDTAKIISDSLEEKD
jgi:hypothetical protein